MLGGGLVDLFEATLKIPDNGVFYSLSFNQLSED